LLCHAIEWYARMEILPDTGGDYREKRNYWSASGANSTCEKRKTGTALLRPFKLLNVSREV
jgi:hypothetical protein